MNKLKQHKNEITFYVIVVIIAIINMQLSKQKENQRIVDISTMYIEQYNTVQSANEHLLDALGLSLVLNSDLYDSSELDSLQVIKFKNDVDSIKFYTDSAIIYLNKTNEN